MEIDLNTEAEGKPAPERPMLTGVLVAAGIILGSLATIAIPIVHFISVPSGPFIAGLIGGGVAKADEGRIITFGLYVALLMAVPSGLLVLLGFLLDVDSTIQWLLIIVGFAIVPYTWWAVTVGALIGYLMRRNEAKQRPGGDGASR
ncbi:MAG: hypothetical protein IH961_08610 [Chloroflexi bacterium]|nr:hypothetical protein [Chloroflexota bacterium]